MELIDIFAVVKLAEVGGFHKAAAELGVDTSALSRRVRRLEDEVGFPLFERSRYGVALTGGGQEIVRLARKVIEILTAIQISAGKAGRAQVGMLRLATQVPWVGLNYRQALRNYRDLYPEVSLVLNSGSDKSITDGLREHMFDAAILFTMNLKRDLASLELWSERLVLAVADRHHLAGRQRVDRHDILKESVILLGSTDCILYRTIESAPLGAGSCFQIHKAGFLELMGLVSLGEGVMVCLESHREIGFPGVRLIDIDDPNAVLGISLAWSPTLEDPIAGSFVATIRDWIMARSTVKNVVSS